ncbi:MAG: type II toxin-antitoxin system RelE/ParE family toxin [Candidatus Acidiferrales bacterium]
MICSGARPFPCRLRGRRRRLQQGRRSLRIRDRAGIYRVFYLVKSAQGILVFHAFVKKSRATPRQEAELGRKRLKELLDEEN